MIPDAPWRVVLVSQIPLVAKGYAELVRALGHEPVALMAARFPPQHDSPRARGFAGGLVMDSPRDLDLVYPAGKERIAPVLQSYEPELLETEMMDVRWGLLGRARLLRGAVLEKLGRQAEARQERAKDPVVESIAQAFFRRQHQKVVRRQSRCHEARRERPRL